MTVNVLQEQIHPLGQSIITSSNSNNNITSFFLLFLLGVGSLLYLLWSRWIRVHLESIKPFPNLPMPPGNHFLWGHLLWFMNVDFFISQKAALDMTSDDPPYYGRIGFWLLSTKTMYVSHWEDARTVLLQTDSRRIDWMAKYHMARAFGINNSPAFQQGREWKLHRQAMVKSLMAPANVTLQQHVIHKVTRRLVQSLHAKCCSMNNNNKYDSYLEMDVLPLMKMVTLDVFGQSVLNHTDFQCCQHLALSPIAHAFDVLGSELTRRITSPSIPNLLYSLPTRRNRNFKQSKQVIRSFVQQLIQEKGGKGSSSSRSDGDMLASLLLYTRHEDEDDRNKENNDNSKMAAVSEEALASAVLGLVFAGYETTSICLTYALYLLASHADEQETCYKEVQRVASTATNNNNDNDPNTTLPLQELAYCRAVILESLRLYPPVYANNRAIEKALTLRGGFVVPAGASVILPTWTMQRLERNFACPNEFRPDRWVKPLPSASLDSKRSVAATPVWVDRSEDDDDDDDDDNTMIPAGNKNALLSFSAGSRSCPGQKFAMQEATLVLAALVKEFTFHLVNPDYTVHAVRHGLVQCPQGGLPLRLYPRQGKKV